MLRSVLGLGVVFFLFALIAAFVGFVTDSTESWLVAKVFLFFVIVLAVLNFVGVWFLQRRESN